jgi:hypothetical protein
MLAEVMSGNQFFMNSSFAGLKAISRGVNQERHAPFDNERRHYKGQADGSRSHAGRFDFVYRRAEMSCAAACMCLVLDRAMDEVSDF